MGKTTKKSKQNREEKRVSIVTLKKAGFTDMKIAKQCGVHRSTVSRVWKRYQTTHTTSHQKRSGRPPILTPRDQRSLVRILKKGEAKTAVDIRKKFQSKTGVNISTETVSNTLRSMGYVSRIKKKKPLLTKGHMKRRLKWAKEFQKFSLEDWKYVVWSDETKFNLVNSDGKEWYWTNKPGVLTEDSIKATKKYGGGCLMVWGCMTWYGLGVCCKIDTTMDGQLYSEILNDELMESPEYYNLQPRHIIFQQDNDPKHTSKIAKATLEKLNIEVMEWPAQSPGMNPIEHLWNHMERKLRKLNRLYSTKDQLWDDLNNILSKKYTKYCQKLISTMPQRVKDLKKAKGFSTRW